MAAGRSTETFSKDGRRREVGREARIGGVEMREGTHLEHIEELLEEGHGARYLWDGWLAGGSLLAVDGVVLPTRTRVIACCRGLLVLQRFGITWGSRGQNAAARCRIYDDKGSISDALLPWTAWDIGRQYLAEIAGEVL